MLTDEDWHRVDLEESLADVREASALMSKLKAADLRALAVKYWRMSTREVRKMGKAEIIQGLAEEHATEILNELWRSMRKPKA